MTLQASLIRQHGSWGRFRISGDMFKSLFAWLDAFLPLLDFVLAFGFKLEPYDENFGGLRRRIRGRTDSIAASSVGKRLWLTSIRFN
jgi:hypothetical protein